MDNEAGSDHRGARGYRRSEMMASSFSAGFGFVPLPTPRSVVRYRHRSQKGFVPESCRLFGRGHAPGKEFTGRYQFSRNVWSGGATLSAVKLASVKSIQRAGV